MSVAIRLRGAREKDLPLIERLLKSNNLPFEDVPPIVRSLFIGYEDSKVVGIVGVEVFGHYGLLRSVVVEQPFRGKGYGKAVVRKIIQIAKWKEVRDLYLLTTTAEGFFAQMGFQRIKRDDAPTAIQNTTEFKEMCPVSSVCMWKKIA